MASPTEVVNKRFKSLSKRPDVPRWFTSIGWIPAVGVLVVVLSFQLLSGPEEEIATGPTEEVVTVGQSPSPGAATPQTTTPEDTDTSPAPPVSPVSGATIDVPTATGTGSVPVPVGAYQAAERVARAIIDGNSSGILLLPGASAPSATGVIGDGYTSTLTVITNVADNVVFSATIDPDGPGPQAAQFPTISVQKVGDEWGFGG